MFVHLISGVETLLQDRLGEMSRTHVTSIAYIFWKIIEQLRAVVPITAFAFLFFGIFFQYFLQDGFRMAGGQILLIIGLMLFLEGSYVFQEIMLIF